jgi:hypothetical protein
MRPPGSGRRNEGRPHAAKRRDELAAGISREVLAERAGLCRHSIMAWENSSHAVPRVTYSHLCRAIDVLEAEGVRFSAGVYLQRPTTMGWKVRSRSLAE